MQNLVVADVALRLVDVEHAEVVAQRRRVATTHEVREGGAEVSRRLLQMVVRDLAEQVVDLVRADVVRQFVSPAVVAIDRRELASDVRPRGVAVPQHTRVHVMEECDDDEPRGEHNQGRHIVTGEGSEAICVRVCGEHAEPAADCADRHRAAEDVTGEHRLKWVEVAHAARHETRQQIEEPAEAESEAWVDVVEVPGLVALADWVEDLVFVDIGRVAVVVSVRQLPRVIGHKYDCVQQRAEDVVEQVVLREGAVAAVVAQHEYRPHQRALQEPVGGRRSQVQHADRLSFEQQHRAVQRAHQHNVLADEVQRAGEIAAETVRRNHLLDVDDRRHLGRPQRFIGIVTATSVGGNGRRRR